MGPPTGDDRAAIGQFRSDMSLAQQASLRTAPPLLSAAMGTAQIDLTHFEERGWVPIV
jgi:hypothetical protein